MASSARLISLNETSNTYGSPGLYTDSDDVDKWLRRSSVGLYMVLDAWSQRITDTSFRVLIDTNPRLAATIAYQLLGDSLGGYLANLILEHCMKPKDMNNKG